MDKKKSARLELYKALLNVRLAELEAKSFADLTESQATGILLFAARGMRDLSQRELARLSGVNAATIWRIESGNTRAQFRTLRDLARALRIPEWQLDPEQAMEPHPLAQQKRQETVAQEALVNK